MQYGLALMVKLKQLVAKELIPSFSMAMDVT